MSISATRKVSNTSAPAKRPERYVAGVEEHPFVENIDTTNNVFVRDENRGGNENNPQAFDKRDKPDEGKLLSGATYIPSAIEALTASGVYETPAAPEKRRTPSQVDVYGNNQSIIKEDDDDRTGHSYLKHFYEKNEIIEEVDEFV